MISVLGRRREFGVLQAMGLTGVETGFVVFLEGLFLTFTSGVAGISAGLLFTWGLFRDGLDFSIFMEDGLEQGCGLSCLILPLMLEVLIQTFFRRVRSRSLQRCRPRCGEAPKPVPPPQPQPRAASPKGVRLAD